MSVVLHNRHRTCRRRAMCYSSSIVVRQLAENQVCSFILILPDLLYFNALLYGVWCRDQLMLFNKLITPEHRRNPIYGVRRFIALWYLDALVACVHLDARR